MVYPVYDCSVCNQPAKTKLTEALKSVAITSAPDKLVGPSIVATLFLVFIFANYLSQIHA